MFVQTGDGRPKCVPTPGWLSASDAQYVREMAESKPSPWKKKHWTKAVDAADRWWLVECEGADAGRAIIAAKHDHKGRPLDKSRPFLLTFRERFGYDRLTEGHILASGGRDA